MAGRRRTRCSPSSIGDDATAELWRWTEAELDAARRSRGRCISPTGSLRLAADEEERDELREEYEALRAAGFAAEWREGLAAPLERYPAALFHPPDGVAAAGAARPSDRRARGRGGRRDPRAHPCRLGRRGSTPSTVVVATDGYPSGLLGELEGLIVPTRGQVIATEPIEEMLFEIPHYGRHGFDYWHQRLDGRIVAGGFRDVSLDTEFTDEEMTTPVVQGALERSSRSTSAARCASTTAGPGSSAWSSTSCRSSGASPATSASGSPAATRGTATCSASLCGALVARAILGESDPQLELFEPARLLVH